MTKVAAEAKGADRFIGRQAQLSPVCAAKGLYSNDDGTPMECDNDLGHLDPHHAWGASLTLCGKCRGKLEDRQLELEELRREFGSPESTPSTSGHGGLEEAFAKKHLEPADKTPTKKQIAEETTGQMFRDLEHGL